MRIYTNIDQSVLGSPALTELVKSGLRVKDAAETVSPRRTLNYLSLTVTFYFDEKLMKKKFKPKLTSKEYELLFNLEDRVFLWCGD